jgi:very-short-patch-repair endonuclease
MVIEVDGGQHNMAKGRAVDEQRDAYLSRNGFRVLRFWNNEVLRNTDGVMHVILEKLNLNTPTPTPPRKGEGLRSARVARPQTP